MSAVTAPTATTTETATMPSGTGCRRGAKPSDASDSLDIEASLTWRDEDARCRADRVPPETEGFGGRRAAIRMRPGSPSHSARERMVLWLILGGLRLVAHPQHFGSADD